MGKWWRYGLTLLLFATLAGPGQEIDASAQPPVIEATQEIQLDFPLTATFTLNVATQEQVDYAELRYTTSGHEYSSAAVVDPASATSRNPSGEMFVSQAAPPKQIAMTPAHHNVRSQIRCLSAGESSGRRPCGKSQ